MNDVEASKYGGVMIWLPSETLGLDCRRHSQLYGLQRDELKTVSVVRWETLAALRSARAVRAANVARLPWVIACSHMSPGIRSELGCAAGTR